MTVRLKLVSVHDRCKPPAKQGPLIDPSSKACQKSMLKAWLRATPYRNGLHGEIPVYGPPTILYTEDTTGAKLCTSSFVYLPYIPPSLPRNQSCYRTVLATTYDHTSSWYWLLLLIFLTISSAFSIGRPRCSAIIWPSMMLTSLAMLDASPHT